MQDEGMLLPTLAASDLFRPCLAGLGFTVFTVPTASKQGLRPCTLAPAAGFRLRRAMLDPALLLF